jgi:predicted transposase YdaD
MPNHIDRILRDGIFELFRSLLSKKLGIPHKTLHHLSDNLHTTLDLESDFAVVTDREDPENSQIAHLEFQYKKEHSMGRRMLEYYTVLGRKFNLSVIQLVVFLHPKKGRTSGRRRYQVANKLLFFYDVLYLEDVPYRELLELDDPKAAILAILGDFGDKDPAAVIDEIFERLKKLEKDTDKRAIFVAHLWVLSKIRKLQHFIEQKLKTMSSIIEAILEDYPFTEDDFLVQQYLARHGEKIKAKALAEGKAEGIAKGKAEGKVEGIAEGKAEGKAEGIAEGLSFSAARLLQTGKHSPEEIAQVLGIPLHQVLEIRDTGK